MFCAILSLLCVFLKFHQALCNISLLTHDLELRGVNICFTRVCAGHSPCLLIMPLLDNLLQLQNEFEFS